MKLMEDDVGIFAEPEVAANAAVIWLHGLGASGHDFAPLIPELALPPAAPLRFVFPHAPVQAVTLHQGLQMRAWYDILSLHIDGPQDEAGLRRARAFVEGLIEQQLDCGIAASRIVLVGFSQGGAVAYYSGLRYAQRLAGIVALSTYLPLHRKTPAEASAANRDAPIAIHHGRFDPVVPLRLGEASREFLRSLGYRPSWHDYPMQHEVCLEELRSVGESLRTWLSL